jgi:hypothetical protein
MVEPQQSKTAADTPKRKIPEKCIRCALLEANVAQDIHGSNGDGCWNPKVCYARRSHAKHRDRRNAVRNLKKQKGDLLEIVVPIPDILYGVLVVYRPAGANTPVHAIAAEVWNAHGRYAFVAGRHCAGMTPSKVENHVQEILDEMDNTCGIKKFESQERREVFECPLRPCPHHSAGRG